MNCNEVREVLAEMSVGDAVESGVAGHIALCAECRRYQGQLSAIFHGLSELSIPHPETMHPPVMAQASRSPRLLALVAAMLVLVAGALAAMYYREYLAVEEDPGPGGRDALFYTFGKDGSRTARSLQNGQSEPEQSTPSPSDPSRN